MQFRRLLGSAGGLLLLLVPVPTPTVRLPTPVPTALPTALPTVLPTVLPTLPPTPAPTLPPVTVPALPVTTPGLPVDPPILGSSPVPQSGQGTGSGADPPGTQVTKPAASAGSGTVVEPASRPVGSTQNRPRFLEPFIHLPGGHTGEAIAIALIFLPLLLALWLLMIGRTLRSAQLARSSSLRLHVAADLGIPPRELSAMSAENLAKVRDEISVDELTGVARRASGLAGLERELARSRRHARPLVVAFVDVDGLKKLNDNKGHSAGDALLKGVAQVLRKRLRAEDLVFRYGGDEFVCLLPDTACDQARPAFEEMLKTARQKGLSFSYGLAEHRPGDDAVSLLGRADQALYEGREGRKTAGEPVAWREGSRRPVTL